MSFADESHLVVLLIGLLVASAAGNIVQVSHLGFAGNLVVGLVGAFVGHWVLPQMHHHVLASLVLNAMIGAIIPLLSVRSRPMLRSWAMGNDPPVTRGFEGVWRLKSGEPM